MCGVVFHFSILLAHILINICIPILNTDFIFHVLLVPHCPIPRFTRISHIQYLDYLVLKKQRSIKFATLTPLCSKMRILFKTKYIILRTLVQNNYLLQYRTLRAYYQIFFISIKHATMLHFQFIFKILMPKLELRWITQSKLHSGNTRNLREPFE